jgi:hypothetical protein
MDPFIAGGMELEFALVRNKCVELYPKSVGFSVLHIPLLTAMSVASALVRKTT